MVHKIIPILTRYIVVFHPQQIPYFEPVKWPLFHCSHEGLPPLGMLRLDLTDPHLIDPQVGYLSCADSGYSFGSLMSALAVSVLAKYSTEGMHSYGNF